MRNPRGGIELALVIFFYIYKAQKAAKKIPRPFAQIKQ
jgi:hypothetical protein